MQGFLNLNKPFGITSHDCVSRVRRILRLKRVGHGGTLDPAATGVLPIALGKATRLLQFLPPDKAYLATIRLGVGTTTDDLEGEIIASQSVPELTLEQIQAALSQFQGKIQQIPPSYSAIQVQGKRLYDLARAGEKVTVPVRTVEVFKTEILAWRGGDFPEVDVAIACGGGTYIRAIARDLGTALNTFGTLAALTRTESCGFHLSDSLTLEQLEAQVQQGAFAPISPTDALKHLAAITLSPQDAHRWCLGQRLKVKEGIGLWVSSIEEDTLNPASPTPLGQIHGFAPTTAVTIKVQNEDGQFLGIGKLVSSPDGQVLSPQMVFESVNS